MNQKIFMKKAIILFLLIGFFTLTGKVFANSSGNLTRCSENPFTDADKRDFGDLKPFKFDVDGDGRDDTISPRTYKVKADGKQKGVKQNHWITFDLKTSQGKTINSFFKFKYGNNLADYWVYALIPCKIGGGAKNDLLFYAGDDGGDETVILANRGSSFRVHSRKTTPE